MPGGTHLHTAQQLPQALLHRFGLDDNRHLSLQAFPQSIHHNKRS